MAMCPSTTTRSKTRCAQSLSEEKAGCLCAQQQAGERSAVLLSLIESAKLNRHDPSAYLKDVFDRLPTLKQRNLAQLLPHRWQAPIPPAVASIVKLVAA